MEFLKDNDIFILQYPNGNDLSFSYGKILSLNDNYMNHSSSTLNGSSGSPIIRRSKDNYEIGLHFGGNKNNKYNLATKFNIILKDISNEIFCVYNTQKHWDNLKPWENHAAWLYFIHPFYKDIKGWDENDKKVYLESKEIHKEIYGNPRKYLYGYFKDSEEFAYFPREFKKKFKYKIKSTNLSFMFYDIEMLKSIDLSSFNAINVTNMRNMFWGCSSLESINLSSLNTTNVTDMNGLFSGCFL